MIYIIKSVNKGIQFVSTAKGDFLTCAKAFLDKEKQDSYTQFTNSHIPARHSVEIWSHGRRKLKKNLTDFVFNTISRNREYDSDE